MEGIKGDPRLLRRINISTNTLKFGILITQKVLIDIVIRCVLEALKVSMVAWTREVTMIS